MDHRLIFTNESAYWVHNLNPFVIQFGEGFGIRWYSLAYILGFIIAAALLRIYSLKGRINLDAEERWDVLFKLMLGVLIGGRLGYVLLYETSMLWLRPWGIIAVWEGGMASHGGFLGVGLSAWLISRKYNIQFWKLSDVIVSLVPSGLLLGRLANFINGELWGKVSYMPWAVIFPDSAPLETPVDQIFPRHPSQLYAAVLEGLIPLIWVQWRFWRSRKVRENHGRLTFEFLGLYAIVRIIGEQFREPDASLIFGLSRGVAYSFSILIILAILWAVRKIEQQPMNQKISDHPD